MDKERVDQHPKESSPVKFKELINFFQTDRKPVDYTQMIFPDSSVVAIGENHRMKGHKIEILQALDSLRQLGFTHLGVEMVHSAELDQYLATGEGRDETISHLRKHFGHGKENPKLHMDIFDQANQLGFKIVPIDNLNDDERREQHMANSVTDILDEDPSYKIVTFTGEFHSTNSGYSMANLLARNGVKITTIIFMNIFKNQKNTAMDKAIRQANLTLERFMLPNRIFTQWAIQSDWLIHLPQTEVADKFTKIAGLLHLGNYTSGVK